MLIDATVIPAWLNLVCALLMAIGLGTALRLAEWRALRAVPARLHLLFGAVAGCTGLWLLGVAIADTLYVHLLGMTSVTLVLGWRFGIICGSLALLGLVLVKGEPLLSIPVAWLLSVAVPASLSRWLVSRISHLRIQNLFIFTLGGGFAGGMLSALGVAALAIPTLWLIGRADLASQALEGWPMIALVLFPEGFINGMLVSAACIFFPGAVKTFDEDFYFGE